MIYNLQIFKSPDFIELCRVHKVKELYAFGSVANGNANENSDVDLLVDINELNPVFRGKLLLSLYSNLELFFNKKIDLLTVDSIRNPILEEYIGTSKKLVYEQPRT